jgi:very-short-patch-repair endonuclease
MSSVKKLGAQIKLLTQSRLRFEKFPTLSVLLETDLDEASQTADLLLKTANYARTAHDARQVEEQIAQMELSRLLEEMKSTAGDLPRLVDMLWYSWSTSIVESMGSRVLGLTKTGSEGLTEAVSVFQQLDRKHIDETPERIRAIWAKRFTASVAEFEEEWNSLSAALNRKRSLPGIRSVFGASSSVVSALKPCWVMSPLSVSMLRPPVGWFDVVIFDEASQILPADAITSIKAARQVVVAGDDRQLPPTTFFASGESDEADDDESDDDAINVGHYESILSLMKFIITKPRELRWHYRSRDERLIAFSNEHLYKSLITFPDSAEESCLRFVRVEGGERSISKRASNPAEVESVVELVREHAAQRPEESLGVIALGSPHATAIEDALWEAASVDDTLAEFLEKQTDEPFFVKNLERVQGDERDAIILTIGYGRNQHGDIVYNFGPINGRFGERRLNVAVTRAKNRMTLVSSFSHAELDEKKCKSGGLPFMRDYLRYVESEGTEFGDSTASSPEMNAFERSIYTRLTELGYRVIPQYGIGKYRVDFAVVSPEDPTKFALAIECDGASYHSQPTARERDRLRQEALERRGWRFHRIWSTDWFRDPDFELAKCVQSIMSAANPFQGGAHRVSGGFQDQLFDEQDE